MRINEAFGDTVNWDFIPAIAIADLTVMDSNPIFGLNAIGGSINITMKDGFSFQGADFDTRFGSFGRKQASAEAGVRSGTWAAYGAFEAITDDGFRDFSGARSIEVIPTWALRATVKEFHFNFTGATNEGWRNPRPCRKSSWTSVGRRARSRRRKLPTTTCKCTS